MKRVTTSQHEIVSHNEMGGLTTMKSLFLWLSFCFFILIPLGCPILCTLAAVVFFLIKIIYFFFFDALSYFLGVFFFLSSFFWFLFKDVMGGIWTVSE